MRAYHGRTCVRKSSLSSSDRAVGTLLMSDVKLGRKLPATERRKRMVVVEEEMQADKVVAEGVGIVCVWRLSVVARGYSCCEAGRAGGVARVCVGAGWRPVRNLNGLDILIRHFREELRLRLLIGLGLGACGLSAGDHAFEQLPARVILLVKKLTHPHPSRLCSAVVTEGASNIALIDVLHQLLERTLISRRAFAPRGLSRRRRRTAHGPQHRHVFILSSFLEPLMCRTSVLAMFCLIFYQNSDSRHTCDMSPDVLALLALSSFSARELKMVSASAYPMA